MRYGRSLRTRFVEFFGPTPQPQDVRIAFHYTANCRLQVALDQAKHKYLDVHFSQHAWRRVVQLINESRRRLGNKNNSSTFPLAQGKLASEKIRSSVLAYLRKEGNQLFGYEKELFFIPAGRSMLSTLSVSSCSTSQRTCLNYPMRQFVDTVNMLLVFFSRSLDEIVRDKMALSSAPLSLGTVCKALEYMRGDPEKGIMFTTGREAKCLLRPGSLQK